MPKILKIMHIMLINLDDWSMSKKKSGEESVILTGF